MFLYNHYLTTSNAGTTIRATATFPGEATSHTTHTWAYDGSSYTEASHTSGVPNHAVSYQTVHPAGPQSGTQVTQSIRWSESYTLYTNTTFPTLASDSATSSSTSSSTAALDSAVGRSTTRDTTYAITGETTASSTHSQTFAFINQSGLTSTFSGTASRVRTSATYSSSQSGTTSWPVFIGAQMDSFWSYRVMVTRSRAATNYSFSTQYHPVAFAWVPTATVSGVQPMLSLSAGSYSYASLCDVITSSTVNTGTITQARSSTSHVITGTLFSVANPSFGVSYAGKTPAGPFFGTLVSAGPVYEAYSFNPPVWRVNGNSISEYNVQYTFPNAHPDFFAPVAVEGYDFGYFLYLPKIHTTRNTEEGLRASRSYATLCWSYLSSAWRLFASLSQASTSEVIVTYTELGDVTSYDEENEIYYYETLTYTESWTASSRMPSGSTTTTEIQTAGTSASTPTVTVARTSPTPAVPWSTHGLNQISSYLTSAAAWFSHRVGSTYATSSTLHAGTVSTQSGSFTIGTGDCVLDYPVSSLTVFSALPAKSVSSSLTGTASGLYEFGSFRFMTDGGPGLLGNAKFNALSRGDPPAVSSRGFFPPINP